MTTKIEVKTTEALSDTKTVYYSRGSFYIRNPFRREGGSVLQASDISKIAAAQDNTPGMTGEEARALVRFAGRIMTAIRLQGGVR